jgi:ribose transport system substrate-binding protein
MAAGEELGVEVTFNGPDTENEGEKQLNQLQAAINDKPAGIGFAAQNGAEEGAPAMLEEAAAAGIKIVAYATPMTFYEPIATVASDNEAMGQMAAEQMIELLDGSGDVAIITNGEVGDAAVRRDSFKEYIEANAPGIKIVDIQNGEADRAKSRDKAQAILQAHPDLAGFYGTSDNATIAAGDEVAAKGYTTKVIGIDATPDLVTMIEAGQVTGIVTQNAYDVGYTTVKVLVDIAQGNPPAESYVPIPSVWATADNLNEPAVQQALGF